MALVATLTIDHTKVSADLTDFPIYVDLADMPNSFWSVVANGGGDIRVFKSDGTTELPREVVSCDTGTNTGELHIKYSGTLSSSVDTEIQIHADGVSSDYAVTDTYGAENVWTGFRAVWHMSDLTTSSVEDSTGDNDGTKAAANQPLEITGKIGDAQEWGGNSYRINPPEPTSYKSDTTGSISAWVKTPNSANIECINNYGQNGTSQLVRLMKDASNKYSFNTRRNTTANAASIVSSVSASNDTWDYVVVTSTGSAYKIYINGVEDTSATVSTTGTGVNGDWFGNITLLTRPSIGYRRYSTNGDYWGGEIDEHRITSSTLSADWITTEYNNQNSPSSFYSTGQQVLISETCSLTEFSTNLRARNFSVSETTTLTESVSVTLGKIFTIFETVSLSETLSTPRAFLTTISETLGLTEVLVSVKRKWESLTKNYSSWTEKTKNSLTWTEKDKN